MSRRDPPVLSGGGARVRCLDARIMLCGLCALVRFVSPGESGTSELPRVMTWAGEGREIGCPAKSAEHVLN